MGFPGQEYWIGLPFLCPSAEDVRRQKMCLVLGTKPGTFWVGLLPLPWGSQRRNTWLIQSPLLASGASDLPLASKNWNVLYEWIWETRDQEIEWCCLHPWTQPARYPRSLASTLGKEWNLIFFNQTTKLCPIPTTTQPYTCVPRNSQRLGKYLRGLKLTGLPLTVLCHTWAQCGHPCGSPVDIGSPEESG